MNEYRILDEAAAEMRHEMFKKKKTEPHVHIYSSISILLNSPKHTEKVVTLFLV